MRVQVGPLGDGGAGRIVARALLRGEPGALGRLDASVESVRGMKSGAPRGSGMRLIDDSVFGDG
jgi:hypothetical protein